MTCIIGLKRNGHVYLGGDKIGINAYYGSIHRVKTSKVWKKGSFIFGSSGSYRANQLVHRYLDVYDLLRADGRRATAPVTEQFMVTKFVPAIKSIFEKHGFNREKEEVASQDADFLIGVHGKLFCLEGDYAILEIESNFCTIGSGYQVAAGAMEILLQNKRLSPTTVLQRAMKAVSTHINSVGSECGVVTTKE